MKTQHHVVPAQAGFFTVTESEGTLFKDLPVLAWRVEVDPSNTDEAATWAFPVTYGETAFPFGVLNPDDSVTTHYGTHFGSLSECQRDLTNTRGYLDALEAKRSAPV